MKYEISYSYLLNVSKAGVFQCLRKLKTPKTQERKMAAKEIRYG